MCSKNLAEGEKRLSLLDLSRVNSASPFSQHPGDKPFILSLCVTLPLSQAHLVSMCPWCLSKVLVGLFIKCVLNERASGWICWGDSGESMVLYYQAEDNENLDKLKGNERERHWGMSGRLGVGLVTNGTTGD